MARLPPPKDEIEALQDAGWFAPNEAREARRAAKAEGREIVRYHLRRSKSGRISPVRKHSRVVAIRFGDIGGYQSNIGVPGVVIEYENGDVRRRKYDLYQDASSAAERLAEKEGLVKSSEWSYARPRSRDR